MRFALALLVIGCGSKNEAPPVEDLTCPTVVEHVAKLTLRATDHARPLVEPTPPIIDTDPRAFRQRRVDAAIAKACDKLPVDEYGPCARKIVLAAMAEECVDREWTDERKRCLLDAKNAAAIDACGPAPAPTLDVSSPTPG